VPRTSESADLSMGVPEDTRASIREDIADGYLVLAPERVIGLGKGSRFAWWRINPRSGETIAVTDEGLHQVAVGYTEQTNQETGETTVTVHYINPNNPAAYGTSQHVFPLQRFTDYLTFMENLNLPPLVLH